MGRKRDAFEKWADEYGIDFTPSTPPPLGVYNSKEAQVAWDAWLAGSNFERDERRVPALQQRSLEALSGGI
jgi:hypothetical protein